MSKDDFRASAAVLGLNLSDAQMEAFEGFTRKLYEANSVMNLTRVPQEEAWVRHFLDSLLFQDLIPMGASLLDIGTGPGFPAWPIACARPDLSVTALDSTSKMLGFLSSAPLPNLKVVLARAEEWDVRERFEFVTGRALAPLPIQLELSTAPCRQGGLIVPMRTPTELSLDEVALEPLGLRFIRTESRPLPGTDIVRLFPIYQKISKTDKRFPRRWAEIKAHPMVR